MTEELKPCPFCGGEAKFKIDSYFNTSTCAGFKFYIKCSKCDVDLKKKYEYSSSMFSSGQITVVREKNRAIRDWNRRANNGSKTD